MWCGLARHGYRARRGLDGTTSGRYPDGHPDACSYGRAFLFDNNCPLDIVRPRKCLSHGLRTEASAARSGVLCPLSPTVPSSTTMRPMSEQQTTPPVCEQCGTPMKFVRSVPRVAELPGLNSFVCSNCKHASTREVDEPQSNRPD